MHGPKAITSAMLALSLLISGYASASNDPISANPNTGANFNRYAYANNNPYKFIDPDGRASQNTFWDGDALFHNAAGAFNIPGTHTLAGHGNIGVFQVDKSAKHVRGLNFEQTYKFMQDGGLKRGQDVFSISCRFGMAGADGKSLAQQTADTNGSKVYGADGWTNYE